jgi:hypothetical protein
MEFFLTEFVVFSENAILEKGVVHGVLPMGPPKVGHSRASTCFPQARIQVDPNGIHRSDDGGSRDL